jgi:hypothetical protein
MEQRTFDDLGASAWDMHVHYRVHARVYATAALSRAREVTYLSHLRHGVCMLCLTNGRMI